MPITQTFYYTGGIQTFTVPSEVTSLTIKAIGASGGSAPYSTPGHGTSMQGDFSVAPGEIITILVGGKGGNADHEGAGGGGGSFVWFNSPDSNLLLAAGGGGGASYYINGLNTVTTSSGTNGNPGGAGGTNRTGGLGGFVNQGGYWGGGGGGAGIISDGGDGANGYYGYGAKGGHSIIGDAAGGAPGQSTTTTGPGGYGGGGGGGFAGGGGGGYSGGGGGGNPSNVHSGGGGGGSYNSGINQINLINIGTGNGQVVITYSSINASFTTDPTPGLCALPVTFNASSSHTDPGCTITNYHWNFGDGTDPIDTLSSPIITHTFFNTTNYLISLTITDNCGNTNTTSVNFSVICQEPKSDFTFSPTPSYCLESITFNGSSSYSSPCCNLTKYEWNFGDGSTTQFGSIINHTYSTDGIFIVSLTVTDQLNQTNTSQQQITINAAPPVSTFTFFPPTPLCTDEVIFDASSSKSCNTIISYEWNFGDGSSSQLGTIINHTYITAGTFIISLTVTDEINQTSTSFQPISILSTSPVSNFTFSPTMTLCGKEVTFDASSSESCDTIVVYQWDFGDDSTISTSEPITTHNYNSIGTFTITLTIIDTFGKSDTSSSFISVNSITRGIFLF